MSILEKLASSLNRRDELPNQALAQEIVQKEDVEAIQELVTNLSNKKAIQNDCIKVLYEIGSQKPALITNYLDEFVKHLSSRNNRLQWGAMMALNAIANERPGEVHAMLPTILSASDGGSVITKDHAVNILIKLCSIEGYADNAFSLLTEQLLKSPVNQLPMYAERALTIVNKDRRGLFVDTLGSRLGDIGAESKRKRVEQVKRKANKLV